MEIEIYRKLCDESEMMWTAHCLQRMQERDYKKIRR